MSYSIDIYIGSDNGSKRIDRGYIGKIERWANDNFPEGYTLIKGRGYYRGVSEDSLLINVLTDYDLILKNRVLNLKQELNQDSILVVKS